jgi:hypothetical protein
LKPYMQEQSAAAATLQQPNNQKCYIVLRDLALLYMSCSPSNRLPLLPVSEAAVSLAAAAAAAAAATSACADMTAAALSTRSPAADAVCV